jgi:dTMP kinase
MSLFITLEGVEGSGKTTQIRLLAENLRQRGRDVLVTREPGGCPLSDKIRHLLLQPDQGEVAPATELFLYLAARAQHVAEIIRPALAAGRIVLCDRFADATSAYQGFARGIDLDLIQRFNAFAVGGLAPDLTLLLDLPVDEGRKRLSKRNRASDSCSDRLELESDAFHQQVRQGYLSLSRKHPERFRVVNALAARDEVAGKICRLVQPFVAEAS